MTTRFELDKDQAKLMGVCSGLARWTDADPTMVRLAMVLVTLFAGPVALLAYVVTGMVAPR